MERHNNRQAQPFRLCHTATLLALVERFEFLCTLLVNSHGLNKGWGAWSNQYTLSCLRHIYFIALTKVKVLAISLGMVARWTLPFDVTLPSLPCVTPPNAITALVAHTSAMPRLCRRDRPLVSHKKMPLPYYRQRRLDIHFTGY